MVWPANLQSITLSHQVDSHKTLTTHKLACSCFVAPFCHQYSKLICRQIYIPPNHPTLQNPTITPGDNVPAIANRSLPTTNHYDLPNTPPITSSIPSVEDFTNAFPTQVTPIVGEPTYATLKTLKDQLKANAASVPTTLGGGNHGYLGLILSPATYVTISPTAFIEPAYPGQHPAISASTNAANTSAIIRCHTEDTRQWREFKNVSTALKNQLLSAAEDIYVRALRDRHVGYMNQSIRNLLTHRFENYGNITQLELEDNDTKMRALWDPNSPFDCLVQQLEDGQDYTDNGGQPYTTDQLLRIAYTLVFKTGLYFEDCKAWNAKPNNE